MLMKLVETKILTNIVRNVKSYIKIMYKIILKNNNYYYFTGKEELNPKGFW